MKVIIPMSGFGERFRRAGYTLPKPLIPVEGRPIISHVIDMFPGETDFIFICNRDHIQAFNVSEIIQKYCPTGKIISIEPHKKGPVYAVSQVFDHIDDNEPVIVNYCDFTCYWNYSHFKKWVSDSGAHGVLPAYRGFHPHSLGSTNYAFMREDNRLMLEIQEKKPFTADKMSEFASSGTYYFSKGEYVKRFFSQTIADNHSVNGEYYCSLSYNLMVDAGLVVAIYELQHFMQWGTPQDVDEYNRYSNLFHSLATARSSQPLHSGTTLIPLAGLGSRFKQEGFTTPKPFLEISGLPMVVQATRSLPKTEHYQFAMLKSYFDESKFISQIKDLYPNSGITSLDAVTKGQACTCLAALKHVDLDQPLTISACDHAVLFNNELYTSLLNDPNTDVIVWATKGHPDAKMNPQMYGWLNTAGSRVTGVSVKKPLNDPTHDPTIIGTFTFKKASMFKHAAEKLIERSGVVNGEYYVDSCIEDALSLGLNVRIFLVDHYLCWGTPNDFNTFKYWQSCFHKWSSHPYTWPLDRMVLGNQEDSPDFLYSKELILNGITL